MAQHLTCRWTVQMGHATSLIRLPDPLDDFEPKQREAKK